MKNIITVLMITAIQVSTVAFADETNDASVAEKAREEALSSYHLADSGANRATAGDDSYEGAVARQREKYRTNERFIRSSESK